MTETTAKGLLLPCPRCGEPEACISLHLDDGETFTCRENDCEFTVADVRALVAGWGPLLVWLDAMPAPANHTTHDTN